MFIDAHIHRGVMPEQYVYDLSLGRQLEIMDALHIQYAVSSHCKSLIIGDLEGGTADTIQDCESSGGRIRGFFYYTPEKRELSLELMKANSGNPVFVGIKIHPSWSHTSADDESYRQLWEYARSSRLPILSHTWDLSAANPKQAYSHPARFEKFIKEYPDVQIVFAHSGGRYSAVKAACGLARRYSNIYFDIAGDIVENGFLEYISREVGSKRIMYGSDYPMMDQRLMLGAVIGSGLSISEKEDILSATAWSLYFSRP